MYWLHKIQRLYIKGVCRNCNIFSFEVKTNNNCHNVNTRHRYVDINVEWVLGVCSLPLAGGGGYIVGPPGVCSLPLAGGGGYIVGPPAQLVICTLHIMQQLLHCVLAAAQCIVIGPVCLWVGVCRWVCYHDNSKLHASILTKLGL